ncbi:hypothetical protein [Palaeococcus ferrophilus]|uniref:hypothetical protein n=1 Tax=Palaeococcus ferrophilus TaxID=83868 RepID=UPI00064F39DC|nr:hypothetical protein [Palaeococcus ferrophilus]
MLVERLVKPRYHFVHIKAEFGEEFVEGLRKRSLGMFKLGETTTELEVDGFLASPVGSWLYLVEVPSGRFLFWSEGPFSNGGDVYLVRDEGALKRLVMGRVSRLRRAVMEIPVLLILAGIYYIIHEEGGLWVPLSLLMTLGLWNELEKITNYAVLGYLRKGAL